jgi:type 1 glutamine amidotransferase
VSFGLRQMARLGKNALLLRDLTDAMYNPAKPPQVSHHRGTELTIAHIERWIAPTALSSEVFRGNSFEFADDPRPVVAVMIGEDEYKTWESLPAYAEAELGKKYRLRYVRETGEKSGDFAGTAGLADARVLLISVRRRALPEPQWQAVQDFIARGGGVVGIRTASHAFALRPGTPLPPGRKVWPEWDEVVLGGNYQQHHGNEISTTAEVVAGADHPVLQGVAREPFPTGSGLYINSPLRAGARPLLMGRAQGVEKPEPVAWTHQSPAGGRVFYTSLGHVADFQRPEFRRLLANAVDWTAAQSPVTQ